MKRIIATHGCCRFTHRRLVGRRHVVGASFRRGSRQPARGNCLQLPDAPSYHSDHSGDCPICHMRLEAQPSGTSGGDAAARTLPQGAVQVSPERQQAIGIRLGVAGPLAGTRCCGPAGAWRPTKTARIRSSPR